MTLENVIAELRSGSNSEFNGPQLWKAEKNEEGSINFKYNGDSDGYCIPLDGWEEIKPKREWSDGEKKMFSLFPWAKWVAVDKNGSIDFFETKPEWLEDEQCWIIGDESEREDENVAQISSSVFITLLTFEEGPQYIGNLKGE